MQAPVNLFFDVTPIGRILRIFTVDMSVFRGSILDPLIECSQMLSKVFVVLTLLLSFGSWEVYLALALMACYMATVATPYLRTDNYLHKIGATLDSPVWSYFYECMRGTSVIRAYGKEESIMKR